MQISRLQNKEWLVLTFNALLVYLCVSPPHCLTIYRDATIAPIRALNRIFSLSKLFEMKLHDVDRFQFFAIFCLSIVSFAREMQQVLQTSCFCARQQRVRVIKFMLVFLHSHLFQLYIISLCSLCVWASIHLKWNNQRFGNVEKRTGVDGTRCRQAKNIPLTYTYIQ